MEAQTPLALFDSFSDPPTLLTCSSHSPFLFDIFSYGLRDVRRGANSDPHRTEVHREASLSARQLWRLRHWVYVLRCFEDIERSMPDLKLLFLQTLLDWFSVWRNQPFSTILDLLDFCNIRFWFVHPCILHVYLVGVSLFLISMNLYSLLLIKKKKKVTERNGKEMNEVTLFGGFKIKGWKWMRGK